MTNISPTANALSTVGLINIEIFIDVRKKASNRRGWSGCLEGQFGRRWPAVSLPSDFVSVDLADQRSDVEGGVAAGEAADAWRQQQNREGREEPLCMQQGRRAGGRPGMLWLDLDHGQLDLLDLDDGGRYPHSQLFSTISSKVSQK